MTVPSSWGWMYWRWITLHWSSFYRCNIIPSWAGTPSLEGCNTLPNKGDHKWEAEPVENVGWQSKWSPKFSLFLLNARSVLGKTQYLPVGILLKLRLLTNRRDLARGGHFRPCGFHPWITIIQKMLPISSEGGYLMFLRDSLSASWAKTPNLNCVQAVIWLRRTLMVTLLMGCVAAHQSLVRMISYSYLMQ